MIGNYSIPGLTNKGSNLCNIGLDGQSALAASCSGAQGYGSTDKYLALFCLAQVVIGLGVTPVWPLSPVYLDENVNPKMSPIYLGVWFVSVFLGRGMGYAIGGSFSRFFTNLALVRVPLYLLIMVIKAGKNFFSRKLSIFSKYE